MKIQTFKDLDVWKQGHALVLSIYRQTQSFPNSELFALTNQIRRATVSITSNIA
jgi:four helix bundle protein